MNAVEQALSYVELGWSPIPIPLREKRPEIDEWQNLRIKREDVPHYFKHEQNVGVLLGQASRCLVDVDLDTPEAVRLAPHFLPSTLRFGRQSNPCSHWLYYARNARTEKFQAINGKMLVELRSSGCQTVFPESMHPSGELVRWEDEEGEDAIELPAETLRMAVACLASAVLLAQDGWKDDYAIAVVKDPASCRTDAIKPELMDKIGRWLGWARPTPQLRSVPTGDRAQVMKRARAYMDRAPGAVAGSGGHQTTFDVAVNVIRGFDLSESEAREILYEYNRRCDPPWSERELEHKLADVMKADRVGRGWLLEDRRPASNTAPKASAGSQVKPEAKAEDATPARPAFSLIELGSALTPELIALQKDPLPTGIASIDEQLGGGYFPGELIVLQASTGVGKTSFNLFTQCAGVAGDSQRGGLYVTTEMQAHELQARRACQVLNDQGVKCTWREVLKGIVPLERTRAATENTRIHVLPMRPSLTVVETIRAAAHELADKYGKPPLIIADYLQALSLGVKEERRIAVGSTIYDLQGLAVEMQTPVVAISSISRAGNTKEKRDSDDPYDFLNISKESGEIEFAAAVLVHLDVKAESDEHGWRAARFILAKTRFGNLGITGLRFHGASGRFEANVGASLSAFDIELLVKIHHGTFPSANALAKVMKNRPKVLAAVRQLQFKKVVTQVAGYLQIDPQIASSLTDHLGDQSND